jgi:transcriptional regulator with XRE-family HTH domain
MPAAKPPANLFGKRLRAARLAARLRQEDLGRLIGLDDVNTGAPRISRYERGLHAPDPETAEAIAEALGLPLAYFYAASDPLAEAILLIAALPHDKQVEALAALKRFAATE